MGPSSSLPVCGELSRKSFRLNDCMGQELISLHGSPNGAPNWLRDPGQIRASVSPSVKGGLGYLQQPLQLRPSRML